MPLALLITSPRVAPGLLSREAWRVLDGADDVVNDDMLAPIVRALDEAGVTVRLADAVLPGSSDDEGRDRAPGLARWLVDRARTRQVVWIVGPDGDGALTDAIAAEVSRLDAPPDIELVVGSWDVPGSRLLDVVAVMDRLRSPGGCPWDAAQTHESLLPYLSEESQEYAAAVRSGDRGHMAEELGDVLLQVAFHARVAEDDPQEPFDIDDVAALLLDKLVRRHPHVFADAEASTPEEVEANWARIKEEEKTARGT